MQYFLQFSLTFNGFALLRLYCPSKPSQIANRHKPKSINANFEISQLKDSAVITKSNTSIIKLVTCRNDAIFPKLYATLEGEWNIYKSQSQVITPHEICVRHTCKYANSHNNLQMHFMTDTKNGEDWRSKSMHNNSSATKRNTNAYYCLQTKVTANKLNYRKG